MDNCSKYPSILPKFEVDVEIKICIKLINIYKRKEFGLIYNLLGKYYGISHERILNDFSTYRRYTFRRLFQFFVLRNRCTWLVYALETKCHKIHISDKNVYFLYSLQCSTLREWMNMTIPIEWIIQYLYLYSKQIVGMKWKNC